MRRLLQAGLILICFGAAEAAVDDSGRRVESRRELRAPYYYKAQPKTKQSPPPQGQYRAQPGAQYPRPPYARSYNYPRAEDYRSSRGLRRYHSDGVRHDHFRLYPGLQIGLPLLGLGFFYDLYWNPSVETYVYQPQPVPEGAQPLAAGLRLQSVGPDLWVEWEGGPGRSVRRVELYLADANQTVEQLQTLTSPPYVAQFPPSPTAAFVGVSVEWGDGSVSTAILPYSF